MSLAVRDVVAYLETVAPPAYQENYDNAGLIVGSPDRTLTGVLICLDSLESIIDEAVERGCNLVVAHHPIVFKGLKRLNGSNYVERVVIKAIKNDVAIYAIHTNLDAVYRNGVNAKIAEKLGLLQTRILAPKRGLLRKLITFVPFNHADAVLEAVCEAGAGAIGDYKNSSFRSKGVGAFTPVGNARPFIGKTGESEKVEEERVEVIFPVHAERAVLQALRNAHPYETPAYDVLALENEFPEAGSGMFGILPEPVDAFAFLQALKGKMNVSVVRHTQPAGGKISKVAVCGGSGAFLLPAAMAAGADVFVTSDFKYHEFFDADGRIIIADVGHFESEQFTVDLLNDLLTKKYTGLLVFSTKIITNPVFYL